MRSYPPPEILTLADLMPGMQLKSSLGSVGIVRDAVLVRLSQKPLANRWSVCDSFNELQLPRSERGRAGVVESRLCITVLSSNEGSADHGRPIQASGRLFYALQQEPGDDGRDLQDSPSPSRKVWLQSHIYAKEGQACETPVQLLCLLILSSFCSSSSVARLREWIGFWFGKLGTAGPPSLTSATQCQY